MANAKPIQYYRETYREHQARAGLFGVTPKEFNARVLARFKGATPYPQMWSSHAFQEVTAIAGRKCCPDAEGISCCCIEAWTCPTHGVTHHGTHD